MLFLTIGTLAGVAAGLLAGQAVGPRGLFDGMAASDPLATFWGWLVLTAADLTVLIAGRSTEFGRDQIGAPNRLLGRPVCRAFCQRANGEDRTDDLEHVAAPTGTAGEPC